PDFCRQSSDGARVGEIAGHHANVRERVLGGEGIEPARTMRDGDAFPVERRTQQDVVPDVTGRASDDNPHYFLAARRPDMCSAYLGSVREMPVSSETVGW